MTPERWQRVGELFDEALHLDTENSTEWLTRICGADLELRREVAALLASDGAARQGFVQNQVKSAVAALFADATPRRIGPYHVLKELGRGGMGKVFLAQADSETQTKVAIKLVQRGLNTNLILYRFRREREVLARLCHPHIARLLDAGITGDGFPYIVMEYVQGSKITDYCRSLDLDVQDRLRLFLQVCSAVEYAHQNFIVHRDIKPGNIMVDQSGAARLLDFGICKLLDTGDTATLETVTIGMPMLTPDYASPEQLRGERVAISSDVYSLAAVLYELLTGAKPRRIVKCTPKALENAWREPVVRPSVAAENGRLARQLSGNLDRILLRALQKDPSRRHRSVAEFSEELRGHLARPKSLLARLLPRWATGPVPLPIPNNLP